MHLRDYQHDAIASVQSAWAAGHTDVLGVAATGAGKTVMFLALILAELEYRPDARVIILAHREELIHQPLERLRAVAGDAWLLTPGLDRPRVGVLLGERKQYDAQLTIATVQTLAYRRKVGEDANGKPVWQHPHLERLLASGPIDYLITDEAHHAIAPGYLRVQDGLRQANPDLCHLGVTATPMRGDDLALANVYRHTAFSITISDLVRAGYLVQPRWLAISTHIDLTGVQSRGGDYAQNQLAERFDTPACRALVVAAHKEYGGDRPAIAFTTSVQGAHDLAQAFRDAGYTAASADGTTDKTERRRILADFREGRFQILVNCGLWTEGLDVPEIACIHLARPTRSDGLYIQMVGRGLRPTPNKTDCLILDYVPEDARNVAMLGDILGCPIPREELLKQFARSSEPGALQVEMSFDGDTFDAAGVDLQIVAHELRYLEQSPFVWHRQDGLLTLGCGRGSDGIDRILAIADGQLWVIWRHTALNADGQARPVGTWQARPWPSTAGDPFVEGERLAAKHATRALVKKGAGWHQRPVSAPQAEYLRKLSQGVLKRRDIDALTAGAASTLINHYHARQAIARAQRTSHQEVA
jgi:superfamily II DNA or RNA helicase